MFNYGLTLDYHGNIITFLTPHETNFKKIMMVANHKNFEKCIEYCNKNMGCVETFSPTIYHSDNPNDYDEWCSH